MEQYPTELQDSAGTFSAAFYRGLTKGLPVDAAANMSRQQLSTFDLYSAHALKKSREKT